MTGPRDSADKPKLPHERDEKAGEQSTNGGPENADSQERMRRAHDDLQDGREDTDRGPVADKTYHELRKK